MKRPPPPDSSRTRSSFKLRRSTAHTANRRTHAFGFRAEPLRTTLRTHRRSSIFFSAGAAARSPTPASRWPTPASSPLRRGRHSPASSATLELLSICQRFAAKPTILTWTANRSSIGSTIHLVRWARTPARLSGCRSRLTSGLGLFYTSAQLTNSSVNTAVGISTRD